MRASLLLGVVVFVLWAVSSLGSATTPGETFHLRLLIHPSGKTCEILDAEYDQVHRALEDIHQVLVFRLFFDLLFNI